MEPVLTLLTHKEHNIVVVGYPTKWCSNQCCVELDILYASSPPYPYLFCGDQFTLSSWNFKKITQQQLPMLQLLYGEPQRKDARNGTKIK